ncbi:anti-sigma-F factor Fin family protein [Virgibacillus siamensis]|uniref:anti-sigma-F factor Fin family protein n=1 Tax=Virgibacillus siamensis TaxID=480071 RepID=UPI0009851B1B|nr:anti-sigma-F factor Fin family protein [Virgibacillus siamensis]
MSIVYTCRHCGHMIGELDQHAVDASMLGLDRLSTRDKQEMVHYQANGDVHIQAICENCEESLGNNPQFHELDYFIQ